MSDKEYVEKGIYVERSHNQMWWAHGRRKVHDYFLLLLCKSSIWFTEQHIFKIIIYFLVHQNVLFFKSDLWFTEQ